MKHRSIAKCTSMSQSKTNTSLRLLTQIYRRIFRGGSKPSDRGRGQSSRPWVKGEGGGVNFFSVLRVLVWSGGRRPGPGPPGPSPGFATDFAARSMIFLPWIMPTVNECYDWCGFGCLIVATIIKVTYFLRALRTAAIENWHNYFHAILRRNIL